MSQRTHALFVVLVHRICCAVRMPLLLSSENIFDYLAQAGLWTAGERCECLTAQPGKNFNLRVKGGARDLLVKQETHDSSGQSSGEIATEWAFYQLLKAYPALAELRSRVVQPLHFDANSSIIVFPYLQDAQDLSSFYRDFCREARLLENAILPVTVAISLGETFAKLHSATFQQQAYKDFLLAHRQRDLQSERSPDSHLFPDFLTGLRRLTPESFCVIPTDALKFFRFYQQYPAIGDAIETLNWSFEPCCVVHNDPKFANFLLRASGSNPDQPCANAQPIDWEKWTWGDPAYDLARLVASYLKLWLQSLPVSANLSLAETLNRASVPLSAVQPSAAALVTTYSHSFSEILCHQPDFLTRIVQFTGLSLIRQVQLYIAQKHALNNTDMAIAQVGKSLLCQPVAALPTVFGCSASALLPATKGVKA